MRAILFYFVLFSFYSCQDSSFDIGSKVDVESKFKLILPNGSATNGRDTVINGITYLFSFKDGRVIFLSTRDKNFHLDNEISLDTEFADLGDVKDKLKLVPGWGHYVPLKNGWCASFSYKTPPEPDAKINSFFKYPTLSEQ